MGTRHPDASVASNPGILAELAGPARVYGLEFLGFRRLSAAGVRAAARRLRRPLARLLAPIP